MFSDGMIRKALWQAVASAVRASDIKARAAAVDALKEFIDCLRQDQSTTQEQRDMLADELDRMEHF